MNMYVSNLGFDVQDEDLKNLFAPYGEVTSAKVITDRETGRSRGFGFVEMADEGASKKAIAELDGTTIENRAISVSVAKPKGEKPPRSNSGSGFNNGRSYNENRY
jgi:RNA recognition motif-containing protein